MNSPDLDRNLHLLLKWIDCNRPNRLAVVMDPNTERHCLPAVFPLLPPHTDLLCLSEAGESIKRIEHAHALWNSLEEAGYDRNSAIIGLGGGTVTDLTGFVASTYLRGLGFWLIPTTLLAMVDAATGGKTGINLAGGKNRIGTFAQPSGISLCPRFLSTLPLRHLQSGLAEHAKHLLLTVPVDEVLERLQRLPLHGEPLDCEAFTPIILESVQIKEAIVKQDMREAIGIRKQLNFGHTAGHALESWAMSEGLDLFHGEAVAWGLGVELALSAGRLDSGSPLASSMLAMKDWLDRTFPCPVTPPDAGVLWKWLLKDKKNEGEVVRMVLLSETLPPTVDQTVTLDEFSEACNAISLPPSNSS